MRSFLALLALAATSALGSQITIPITGTCGFYQGDRSNVVYSETFSGDGTFCTGFQAGGSFTNNGSLVFGDISNVAINSLGGSSPAGYGVFVHIDEEFTVTQQYLVTPNTLPSTPTGFLQGFFDIRHSTDDGSGQGSCFETIGLTFGHVSSPNGGFTIPYDFVTPISSVQSVHLFCDQYSRPGFGFGDAGDQQSKIALLTVLDANMQGNFGANVVTVNTPEPSTFGLMALGLGFVLRRRFGSAR